MRPFSVFYSQPDSFGQRPEFPQEPGVYAQIKTVHEELVRRIAQPNASTERLGIDDKGHIVTVKPSFLSYFFNPSEFSNLTRLIERTIKTTQAVKGCEFDDDSAPSSSYLQGMTAKELHKFTSSMLKSKELQLVRLREHLDDLVDRSTEKEGTEEGFQTELESILDEGFERYSQCEEDNPAVACENFKKELKGWCLLLESETEDDHDQWRLCSRQ